MKETSNPVVWQSRTWLMDALAALMEEKKFEEITVVEICRRADLSRRTFYRNYSSKEDLFRSCCERLCREYVRCLERDTAYFAAHITEVYFSFWKEHRHFYSLYAGMIRSAASSRCPIRTGPKFTAVCNRTGKKP